MNLGLAILSSVLPSFRLSACFLVIDPLAFSENQYSVRGPFAVVRERARFFGKIPFGLK